MQGRNDNFVLLRALKHRGVLGTNAFFHVALR